MSVKKNLKKTQDEIDLAKSDSSGAAKHIQLVAVSKTHCVETIQSAIDCGQRVFGENRVQEAQQKWPELKMTIPDIKLHLIGALQSNKTADALALFDVIQTVDREKIARSIAKEAKKLGKCPDLFVQVNIGSEEQKSGIETQKAVNFVKFCQTELSLPIIGLMCIPPVEQNPGPYFALLQTLSEQAGLEQLSMGMSEDFQTAISFGATYVRVGSAIFGYRDYSQAANTT